MAPVVVGIQLDTIVPSFPFFLRKLVHHATAIIKNVRIFTKKKITKSFKKSHVAQTTETSRGGQLKLAGIVTHIKDIIV